MQKFYKRLAGYLAKNQRLTQWLLVRAQRRPYSTIYASDGKPYMLRWWLFNPYQNADGTYPKRNWLMRQLPSIRFHEILLPDEDRHLHDHPWDAQTLILRGWYIEDFEDSDGRAVSKYREAGDTRRLCFNEFHRIRAVSTKHRQSVLTMFITFKYRGTWGFKVAGVKVPWRQYIANKKDQS